MAAAPIKHILRTAVPALPSTTSETPVPRPRYAGQRDRARLYGSDAQLSATFSIHAAFGRRHYKDHTRRELRSTTRRGTVPADAGRRFKSESGLPVTISVA